MNRLRREGWAEHTGKGSHVKFTYAGGRMVIVPNLRRDLKTGLVRAIYREAGWPWAAAAAIGGRPHDALETVLMHPAWKVPLSIEEGAQPPDAAILAEFEQPAIVIVVAFEQVEEARAA
jgi:predicted RNA binding protein YcfA (HicA-like mRNA interferase family)